MNRVILMGRLTRDPEVRYSSGERSMAIARYTLAVDRRGRRNQGNDQQTADFIPCVAFDRAGEFAEKYFRQGMRVLVSGRIQTGSYTNRDGQKVYTTEVIVDDQEFADKMGELCKLGDYILPNTTEACFLLHKPWKPDFTKDEMIDMARQLSAFTKRYVILKGYADDNNQLGMIVLDKIEDTIDIVYNDRIDYASHGTGDVFASAFVGSTMIGKTPSESAKIAGEFTKKAIEKTIGDENHAYGVKFEQVIPELYDIIKSI